MSRPKSIKIKQKKLPMTPGVYLFRDREGSVIYVGKATNLKSRVGSYFRDYIRRSDLRSDGGRTSRAIKEMVHEVRRIDWITTDSVIEALILEANLIRKYMPKYNVKEKDDKSFLYVVITKDEFPKVMLVRGQELNRNPSQPPLNLRGGDDRMPSLKIRGARGVMKVFGPYTNASAIRAALDLIRKWFPWSTCRPAPHPASGHPLPRGEGRVRGQSRPCFDYHIGRCPGVCIGAISRREYMKNIRNVILMLEGKKGQVIKNVKLKMQNAARAEKFEEAEMWRRKLFALRHIRDVAVIAREPNYESVRILRSTNSSIRNIRVHSPFGSQHAGEINMSGRIEGYDISNISGTSAVGSMVVFQGGEPAKGEYKRFRIKGVRGINDVAMMREVLTRRFRHSERLPAQAGSEESRGSKDGILRSPRGSLRMTRIGWPLPDLLVIDGGWGQVNAAQEVVDDIRRSNLRSGRRLDLPDIPIVGIAKGFKRKQDRPVFDKSNPELARIVENSKDLLLCVRDEAHRFAVAYHRKRMRKRLNTPS